MRDHPTRFIYGSDTFTRDTLDEMYRTLDIYDREGLFDALGREGTEALLKANFKRVFEDPAKVVTKRRLEERKFLAQFRWPPPDEGGGPNSPTNRLHGSGGVLLAAGALGAGGQHGPDLGGSPGVLASSPLDAFNPLAEGSPAQAMNSAAFALRGGLIIAKALYGDKIPALSGDKPLGFLLRSVLLGTYLVNDTVFYQWLANGGLTVDRKRGSAPTFRLGSAHGVMPAHEQSF